MGNTIPHGDRLHECTPSCPENATGRRIINPPGSAMQELLELHGIGDKTYVVDESEPALRQREGDQDLPVANEEVSCQERFMDRISREMPARMSLGRHRYGTLLQPFNGRNFMRDAFDELLDLSVYLEGINAEREAMMDLLYDVATAVADERDITDLARSAQILLLSMGQGIDLSQHHGYEHPTEEQQ